MAGFYERRVFPWLNDKLSGAPEVTELRGEVLRSASGMVIEIGFGSGANLAHYPAGVASIVAIDPNEGMHDRAAPHVKASRIPELSRVLNDRGRLIVMEHGRADDPGVSRWQDRLNAIQQVVACGCHLNRPIQDLVEAADFRFQAVRKFYLPKAPRTHAWFTAGVASKTL